MRGWPMLLLVVVVGCSFGRGLAGQPADPDATRDEKSQNAAGDATGDLLVQLLVPVGGVFTLLGVGYAAFRKGQKSGAANGSAPPPAPPAA